MAGYRSYPSERACSRAGGQLRRKRTSTANRKSAGRTLAKCPKPSKLGCSKQGRALAKKRTSKAGRGLNRCKNRPRR